MSVRVRYAGAPTGDLHVGNVRTALFNWLFARHEKGVFVWRVEDTDPERAKPELIDRAAETLTWLGIDWDEGPIRQSERGDFYDDVVQRLVAAGSLYRCYCAREDVLARGTKTGYDRFCREREDQPDRPFAWRFKVPLGRDVTVADVLRGDVVTPFDQMQDFVVVRSDGTPTFVLANTADDVDMRITHVIRGTDLLSAAAQNVLLFDALGAKSPTYAHVPLILGPDKSRLGARHGAVGTLSYRDSGYLSEAFVNYLALLGWSSPTGDEILSRDRLVDEFTLDRINSSPAIFDKDKLDWLNQEYMKTLTSDEFVRRVLDIAPDTPEDALRKAAEMELVQSRVVRLAEVPLAIRYLHERPEVSPIPDQPVLEEVATRLEELEPWTPEAIKDAVQKTIADLGLHRRKGPKPIFVAISGSDRALPLFESIYLIGREESVARLMRARDVPA